MISAPGLGDADLLEAAAANHRVWFDRIARAAGGRTEHFGDIELVIAGAGGATIPFPSSSEGLDDAMREIRDRGLRDVGCWSLAPDAELGTSLVARGFGWGWQPHWMAWDLTALGSEAPPAHQVSAAEPPYAEDVPYVWEGFEVPDSFHLGVRADGATVGHLVVNPWRGVAGIYNMGVAAPYRRRGIARALSAAAARVAVAQGCRFAVLNATEEGERFYRAVGFRSLGWGQTWWYAPGPEPTPRQAGLAEAIGSGALAALAELDPTSEELRAPLPGHTRPLRLALLTGRLEAAGWLLDRSPALIRERLEPFGATLLHLAVERNQPDFLRLAIDRGADLQARDRTWKATAREWAEHFANQPLAEMLDDAAR